MVVKALSVRRDQWNAYQRARNEAYPHLASGYCKSYRERHPDIEKSQGKKYREKRRAEAIAHYSNGLNCCACCSDNHIEFLGIDHINGGGTLHRKKFGGGNDIYVWLKCNGYPDGFRVLCHNCNMAIGFYGYCPHEGGNNE